MSAPTYLTSAAVRAITLMLEERGLLIEDYVFEFSPFSKKTPGACTLWFYQQPDATTSKLRFTIVGTDGEIFMRAVLAKLDMDFNERKSNKELIAILPTSANVRRYKLQLLIS